MAGQPIWIAVDDGVRLCGDLLLPSGDGPWPALLEVTPHRVHDVTAATVTRHRALTDAGFAVCRLDARGTGSSNGVADDEHPAGECRDLCTAIDWLAARPWCTGRVGMVGTAYGARAALLVAAAGTPALGAVVAAGAADDRYTELHHSGGVLRAIDLVGEATTVALNALPPVPAVFGDGWVDEWARRIETTPPWPLDWLRRQVDGPAWRRGSLRTGPDGAGAGRIATPVMLVTGWADGARNAAFRTLPRLGGPWRLLAGPWGAGDPARSRPGPSIDADAEVVAFLDQHLRAGADPGPSVAQVFVRRPARPEPDLAEHPGSWREAGTWPPPGWSRQTLTTGRDDVGELDVVGDVGTAAWTSAAGALP